MADSILQPSAGFFPPAIPSTKLIDNCGRCGRLPGVRSHAAYGTICPRCAEWLRLEQAHEVALERDSGCWEAKS